MDKTITWFREFLKVEWDAKRAYHLESDTQAFLALRAAYEDLKQEGVGDYLNRNDTPESLAQLKKMFETEGPRVLFAVRALELAGGPAWAFYVSDFMLLPTGRAMDVLFVVQRVDGVLRVQSEYQGCFDCGGTGLDGGDPCEECSGDGFAYSDGVDFGALGRGGETRKFEPPTHAAYRAAYDAL